MWVGEGAESAGGQGRMGVRGASVRMDPRMEPQ